MEKKRIVFMGTPNFAVPILEALVASYEVVLVVCQPDREKDRKGKVIFCPVKEYALSCGISVFQPEKVRNDYQEILDVEADMIVTCAYGQIIPDVILNYPKWGCINVHGSLLPKLRGGAPIHWAIINGEVETGITIMDMNSKMDAGDIIAQQSISIGENDILDDIYERLSYVGRDLLISTLPSIFDGSAARIKQNEELVTFGYNIRKCDEKIDFNKKALEIKNLVRGLNSVPGAYCMFEGKRLKIYEVEVLKENSVGKIGEIVRVDSDGLVVNTGDYLLKIKDIKMEGKKRCLVTSYLNGIVNKMELVGKVME